MTLRSVEGYRSISMLLLLASICLFSFSALAQDTSNEDTNTSGITHKTAPHLPLWEVGLFGIGITLPAYPGADTRVSRSLAMPFLIYRGKYMRVERGNVGVRPLKTPRIEADISFAASLGSHSSDIPARQGMSDLGNMIEFGPRLIINLGDVSSVPVDSRLQFPLREVIDISHNFDSRGVAFEPEWVVDWRPGTRWYFSTNLGAFFGDAKLTNTFYGVPPENATPTRPSYTAKSGLIALRAGLFSTYSLKPDVKIFYFFRIESLAGAANQESPLVQRNLGWAAGIGFAWTLKLSKQNAYD